MFVKQKWVAPLQSADSVKANYVPVDDESDSGYRRPPKISGCVLDYFSALCALEDGGEFAHKEMAVLLNYPDIFFRRK